MDITVVLTLMIICILSVLLYSLLRKILLPLANSGKSESGPTIVDMNIIQNNKDIVNYYIDSSIYETLFYYLNKDLKFDENSVIKIQAKFKYRDCVRNLMRPNVFYSGQLFKNIFIQRVYLLFISETPQYIKDLIFTFNSGYTYDNYYDKKKQPSIQPYVLNYIDRQIGRMFMDISGIEELAFRSNNLGSSEIDSIANELDSKEYAKICSFIYNIKEEVIENKNSSEKLNKKENSENESLVKGNQSGK